MHPIASGVSMALFLVAVTLGVIAFRAMRRKQLDENFWVAVIFLCLVIGGLTTALAVAVTPEPLPCDRSVYDCRTVASEEK